MVVRVQVLLFNNEMMSKDKNSKGKSDKKAPSRTLKEKRSDKAAKNKERDNE